MTDLALWMPWIVSLAIAVIGFGGIIVGRIIRPPVTMNDLWAENRKMRDDIDALIEDRETDRKRMNENEARAEALVRWLQKIARAWDADAPFPMPDGPDLQVLDLTIPRVTIPHNRKRKVTP